MYMKGLFFSEIRWGNVYVYCEISQNQSVNMHILNIDINNIFSVLNESIRKTWLCFLYV